jgi:hypothetical protein
MKKVSAFAMLLALGCGSTADSAPAPAPPATVTPDGVSPPLARGIVVKEVAFFQTVKVSLAKDGEAVKPNAPIVANRAGILRVYTAGKTGWKTRGVTCNLFIEREGKELETRSVTMRVPRTAMADGTPGIFQFRFEAAEITPGIRFKVELRDNEAKAAPDDETGARFPLDGSLHDFGAQTTSPLVKIKLVPVKYDGDQSGRLPSTDKDTLEAYRSMVYKLYPTAAVEVTVREEPLAFPAVVDPRGDGWGELLEEVLITRQNDKAPDDVYYMGVFDPTTHLSEYCTRGCILGIAPLVSSPIDVMSRGGLVLGVDREVAAETLAHELGHAMGRGHAPCGGAAGIDRQYPYSGATVGAFGLDQTKNEFVPASHKDIMGYCHPYWISDYTYSALFERISAVTKKTTKPQNAQTEAPQQYRFVRVAADGKLTWGKSITLDRTPDGEPWPVKYVGAPIPDAVGHFFEYGEGDGGYALVPEPRARFDALRISPPAHRHAQTILRR